jgi:hypothetical protein
MASYTLDNAAEIHREAPDSHRLPSDKPNCTETSRAVRGQSFVADDIILIERAEAVGAEVVYRHALFAFIFLH